MGQAIDEHDLVLRLGRHLTFEQEADLGARTSVRFTDHNHMRLREDVRHPPCSSCLTLCPVSSPSLCVGYGWEPTRAHAGWGGCEAGE
jgi:hypothetical protein